MYEKESTLFTKKEEKNNKQTKRKAFFLPFAANRPGVNAAGST